MAAEYDYSLLKSCGEDVFISANVEICRPYTVSLGNHVTIDTGLYCTVKVDIGDYIHIGPYVIVIGEEQGYLQTGHFTTIATGSRIVPQRQEFVGIGS